jgi:hypothetical protein
LAKKKSVAFLYTNNGWDEKEIRKTILFTIYLEINLTEKMKTLYNKNCKTFKKTPEDGITSIFLDWQN